MQTGWEGLHHLFDIFKDFNEANMADKIEESDKHYKIELPIEDFNKLKELSEKLDVSIEALIRYIIIENTSNRSIQ